MILALMRREFRAHRIFFRISCTTGILLILYLNWVVKKRLPGSDPYPLLDQFFMAVLFLVSLIFGFLLAISQISTDTKTQTEAFLLHRPVSRNVLYGAKFIAGMCLYLATTPLVYVLYVLWTSTPRGHFGPFRWEMAYPGLTHILSGLILYSATLWAASSQKRERVPAYLSVFAALGLAIWYTNAGWPIWSEALDGCAIFLFFCGGRRSYQEREI